MNVVAEPNPALLAAQAAEQRMFDCLAHNQSFLLEAGAGAGKTYSLVAALKFLIASSPNPLADSKGRIACITYTNAATDVINGRIDGNKAVFTDTIHAFCWSNLKGFQSALRSELVKLPAGEERIKSSCGINRQAVEYDLGYRKITEAVISLHHDDVLSLMFALLDSPKFRRLVSQRFPYIFIDEYQDTNDAVMAALKSSFLDHQSGVVIGLFGDHWQQIYEKTCGHVVHEKIREVGKGANFRSGTKIVEVLNKMRPELTQAPHDLTLTGSAAAFHTNGWAGQRRSGAGGGHWKDDLPADIAHDQ